jgi:hypothetical protein
MPCFYIFAGPVPLVCRARSGETFTLTLDNIEVQINHWKYEHPSGINFEPNRLTARIVSAKVGYEKEPTEAAETFTKRSG